MGFVLQSSTMAQKSIKNQQTLFEPEIRKDSNQDLRNQSFIDP